VATISGTFVFEKLFIRHL